MTDGGIVSIFSLLAERNEMRELVLRYEFDKVFESANN